MDITKFLRVLRIRDFSDQSNSGEQQKEVREGSLEENFSGIICVKKSLKIGKNLKVKVIQ